MGDDSLESEDSTEGRPVFKDPRIDKFVSWALTTVAAAALAVGAWFFSDLKTENGKLREELTASISKLNDAVNNLTTTVALQQAQLATITTLQGRIDKADEQYRSMERSFLERFHTLELRLSQPAKQ